MIDLTLPEGVLDADKRDRLVQRLAGTVAKWERMSDEPHVDQLVWTFVDERPAGAITAGRRRDARPRYRVQITVAEGSLDDEGKAGIVADVTRHVLEAEGSPDDIVQAARVWCHIHELPDGNWGAAGTIWRLDDIVKYAGIDAATVPGLGR